MKKIYERLLILGIITVMCFVGCGTPKTEPEEIVTKEQPEETQVDATSFVEVVGQGAVRDYADAETGKASFYIYLNVKNTSDKYTIDGLEYDINIKDKSGTLIKTERTSIGTLAPGETGICGAYFDSTIDFVQNDFGGAQITIQ